jgi:hypothetical protein
VRRVSRVRSLCPVVLAIAVAKCNQLIGRFWRQLSNLSLSTSSKDFVGKRPKSFDKCALQPAGLDPW